MYHKQIAKKTYPSLSATPINKKTIPTPSYGSLSGTIQRAVANPESLSREEWQKLDSSIGTRATNEIKSGKRTSYVPEFKGISAQLWGDSGGVNEPIQRQERDINESEAQPKNQTSWVQEFQGISAQLWGDSGQVREPIQAKLTIGQPNDKYEQEADRVASLVVKQINAPASTQSSQGQSVQRQGTPEEEEIQTKSEITSLQRQEAIAGEETSASLTSTINSARGGGQPLDAGLQQSMGQAMGADFSGVRVHTDAQSDQLNQSLQAKAFTTGRDVFFRQGTYKSGSRKGQELIAHELTHVLQQNSGAVQRRLPLEPHQHPPIEDRAFTSRQDVFFRQGEYSPGSKEGGELIAHELTHVLQETGDTQRRQIRTKPNEAQLKPKPKITSSPSWLNIQLGDDRTNNSEKETKRIPLRPDGREDILYENHPDFRLWSELCQQAGMGEEEIHQSFMDVMGGVRAGLEAKNPKIEEGKRQEAKKVAEEMMKKFAEARTKELKTPEGGLVLWSGCKDLASEYAKEINGKALAETDLGKAIDQVNFWTEPPENKTISYWDILKPFWEEVSRQLAKTSIGDVTVLVTTNRENTVFHQVEKLALDKDQEVTFYQAVPDPKDSKKFILVRKPYTSWDDIKPILPDPPK